MMSLTDVQRSVLLRSIYVLFLPVMLLLAVLACGTAVTERAYYTCPTPVPQSLPTVLPGTLPPPIPPAPTPFTIVPPAHFYLADAVFVGPSGAPLRLRFRLSAVQSRPAAPTAGVPRQLVTWRLEIRNLGSLPYETVPVALMVITHLGGQAGTWATSQAAMQAAGFTNENYDPLAPGSTRSYRLAALVPAGAVQRFAYRLDGDGGNRITWVNSANPYCAGDVAD